MDLPSREALLNAIDVNFPKQGLTHVPRSRHVIAS
jgi:hypothetical protein